MLNHRPVVALNIWLLAMVLAYMTKQAFILLGRMLRCPEIVIALGQILLIKLTLLVGQAGEIQIDCSRLVVLATPE